MFTDYEMDQLAKEIVVNDPSKQNLDLSNPEDSEDEAVRTQFAKQIIGSEEQGFRTAIDIMY